MTFRFKCPQGHVITCPKAHAGKKAKCPKCGARLTVPAVPENPEQIPTAEPLPDSVSGTGSHLQLKKAPGGKEMIVFVCPNGHKLNGPPSLAGTMGLCPHCNEKFQIPQLQEGQAASDSKIESFEEVEPVEEFESVEEFEPIEEFQPVEEFEPVEAFEPVEEIESVEEFQEISPADTFSVTTEHDDFFDDEVIEEIPAIESVPAQIEGTHPMAALLNWMWDLRGEDTVVELSLREGELLTPRYYSRELSQEKYAVFAIGDAEGPFTMITIPWDSVMQVSVRNLPELPSGLFEN